MIDHPWNITPKEGVALQRRLAGEVRAEPIAGHVHAVAGADCAFLGGKPGRRNRDAKQVIAAVVLCDAESMEVIETAHVVRPCEFPYVPGLLSFREGPAVIEAVGRLSGRPDLLLCDGQGRAHPRRLGLASHVGLRLGLPTIGVAKSRLCGDAAEPGVLRGSRAELRHREELIGWVVRSRSHVKPLYVSVGHLVSLGDAVGWTLRCCRGYRMPEPTRQADRLVALLKRQLVAIRPSSLTTEGTETTEDTENTGTPFP